MRIREMRERSGMTQSDVADALDITRTRYANWESEYRDINLADAVKLADLYKCSLDELAGRDWPHDNAAPTVTREMVAFWLEDRCRARDAGALAQALVTCVLLDEDGTSGVVVFAMDGGSVPIARRDVFDLSRNRSENETPSQVGGCSSKSVLVGRFVDKSNLLQVEVLPLIVAVRYGRAA